MLLYERQGDVHFELGGHDDFRNIWFHCVRVHIPFLQSLDLHRSRKADGPPRRWQTRETTRGHLLRHWVLKGMLATTSCYTHTHTHRERERLTSKQAHQQTVRSCAKSSSVRERLSSFRVAVCDGTRTEVDHT